MLFSIAWQMAIAAVAHIFVFSAEPYYFFPASGCGKVTTETTNAGLKSEEGDNEKPDVLEKTEIEVASPGTSVTESVQDIVLQGGQHVSFYLREPTNSLNVKVFSICWTLYLLTLKSRLSRMLY